MPGDPSINAAIVTLWRFMYGMVADVLRSPGELDAEATRCLIDCAFLSVADESLFSPFPGEYRRIRRLAFEALIAGRLDPGNATVQERLRDQLAWRLSLDQDSGTTKKPV